MPINGAAVFLSPESYPDSSAVDIAALSAPTLHKTTTEAGLQITKYNSQWGTTIGAATGPISFGFRTSGATYSVLGHDISVFSPFSASQQSAARAALQLWSDLAGISFSDQGNTNNATILFQNYNDATDGSGAFAFLPFNNTSASSSQGDVFVNLAFRSTAVSPGDSNWSTLIHEIGHALGLYHPGSYNAAPGVTITYNTHAEYIEDTRQYTVMSYFDESFTGANFSISNETPALHDIAAIQRLYGAKTTTRTGDNTYGFNSNVGSVYSITSTSQQAVFAVWDAGGTDTFDFSGYSQTQTIDLRADHFSSVGGQTKNIAIALGVTIENAVGGTGADTITGNDAANKLSGGNGSDTLQGIGGNDTLTGGNATNAPFDSATAKLADFNNDDRIDLLQVQTTGTTVWLSTGSSFSNVATWGTGARTNDKAGDFNGDGRADLIQMQESGNMYVWTSTGTSFNNSALWGRGARAIDQIADVNGDGKMDIVQPHENGNIYVWTSNGSSFNAYTVWGHGSRPIDKLGDVDGNGRADLIELHNNGNIYVWYSKGTSFSNYEVWGHGARSIDKLGDFNGDGKVDIIQPHENGNIYVWLSNGSSFNNYTVWGHGSRPTDLIGDVDGNGRSDLIELHDNGNIYVWYSKGNSFSNYEVWGRGVRSSDLLGDFNGDGKVDIVQPHENGQAYVWLSTGSAFMQYTVWGRGGLTGDSAGNDTFVFRPDFGRDIITDFKAGTGIGDIIQFQTSLFANFNAVLSNTADDGSGNTIISVDVNNSITLLGVLKSHLAADDFGFIA